MDFEGLRRLFKFEVSRFPFLPLERQRQLRRAYRELEAVLRSSARQLEFGWGEPRFLPPRVIVARLGEVRKALQAVHREQSRHLSREMESGLDELCTHLAELQAHLGRPDTPREATVEELCRGLASLKRALGAVHRL